MSKLPVESVDYIFADPPYWMRIDGVLTRPNGNTYDGCDDEWDNTFKTNDDYIKFTKNWIYECKRVLKSNGSFCVIGGMQCIYSIGAIMQELGFWFINDIVWYKSNPTPNFMGTRLTNSHETLIWATKSKHAKYTFNYKTAKDLNTDNTSEEEYFKGYRKQLGSVWKLNICQGKERITNDKGEKLHSTQKLEKLLYRILAINTKVGDIILDPFGRIMTTDAIAKQMEENFVR